MKEVENIEQLLKNIETLDRYLSKANSLDQADALDLVKRGTCFVVYNNNGMMRFAPSRFIGYVDNKLEKHNSNFTKHGGVTNQAISKLFKCKPLPNENLDELYINYCNYLGIKANSSGSFGASRKFWILDNQ